MTTNTENQVTLYIATHNKTGLKYFGKTTKYFTETELQSKYHGSGTYWNKHLKKHGDDVTMEIYGIYTLDEVETIALKFSEENDIVKQLNESGIRKDKKIWANEKPENGLDGNPKGNIITKETREKLSAAHLGKTYSKETNKKKGRSGEENYMYGKTHTEETRRKLSEQKTGKNNVLYGQTRPEHSEKMKGKSNPMYGKKWTEEHRAKMKDIRDNQPDITCPHCGFTSKWKSVIGKYHFDKCKSKGNK